MEAIENTVENTPEKTKKYKYKFRDFTAEDSMPVLAILEKINMEEFKDCLTEEVLNKIISLFTDKAKAEAEGMSVEETENLMASSGIAIFPLLLGIAQVIVKNVRKCDKELFALLSKASEIPVEDIKKMKFGAFLRLVVDFVKFVKEEGFSDFF